MAQHEAGSCYLEKLNAVRTNTYAATITEKIAPAILADSWSPITIVNAPAAHALLTRRILETLNFSYTLTPVMRASVSSRLCRLEEYPRD
jgi:hypothetical protein